MTSLKLQKDLNTFQCILEMIRLVKDSVAEYREENCDLYITTVEDVMPGLFPLTDMTGKQCI